MALCGEVQNKKSLQKTILEVKEVFRVKKMVDKSFKWRIDKFNSMKKNVNYWNKNRNSGWFFTITKKRRFCSVTISTDDFDEDITCFVCYDKEDFSNPIIPDKSTGGMHNITVPVTVIDVSQNMFLKENILALDFRLHKRTLIEKPEIRSKVYGTPSRCYLYAMYTKCFETVRADFIIYAKSKALEAHKAILASRSSYFRQYIQEKCRDGEPGEIKLDTTTAVITKILVFIYQGSICFKSKEQCFEILVMSERLGMPNLQIICKRYIAFFGE